MYEIKQFGRYFLVKCTSELDESRFLGARKKPYDTHIKVDDNVINRLVLGIEVEEGRLVDDVPGLSNYGLLDYQEEDVRKMVSLKNVLNANPMGLGKTVEAIVAMRILNIETALLVVPKSIMTQWKSQIAVWWPERVDDVVIVNKHPSACWDFTGKIVLINYEKMIKKTTLEIFQKQKWNVLLCDEAHRLKNRKSKRTIALKQLKAERRWALTGTPVLNKPDDLWSILHFLDKRYSGNSYWGFVNKFCRYVMIGGYEVLDGLTKDEDAVAQLKELLSVVSIRNPEVQVAKGKLTGAVKVDMTSKQKKLYKSTKELILDELPDSMFIANGAVHVLRLQQVTSYPELFGDFGVGAKFEWIKELLDDNADEKVVIFTKFAKSAIALQKYLGNAALYTGENTNDREEQLKSFLANDKESPQALIGTIGALGEGVDGLQHVSRVAIFLDRDWSSEVMEQAEDRLHRKGQEYPVTVYYLECVGTFDRHIGRVNLSKAEDIRRLLDDEDFSS